MRAEDEGLIAEGGGRAIWECGGMTPLCLGRDMSRWGRKRRRVAAVQSGGGAAEQKRGAQASLRSVGSTSRRHHPCWRRRRLLVDEVTTPQPLTAGPSGIGFALHGRSTVAPLSGRSFQRPEQPLSPRPENEARAPSASIAFRRQEVRDGECRRGGRTREPGGVPPLWPHGGCGP